MSNMYIHSSHAQIGRNFYESIGNGELKFDTGGGQIKYTIKDGNVVKVIRHHTRGEKTVLVYGKYFRRYKHGKLIEESKYRYDTAMLTSGRFYWKLSKDGIIEKHSSGGSMSREKLYYKNGQLKYDIGKGNKNIVIYDKNGNVLIKIHCNGISLSSYGSSTAIDIKAILNLNTIFSGNFRYEIYKNGKVWKWIKGEVGRFKEGYIGRNKLYFIGGIKVEKKVATGNYNSVYAINYPNVTVRAEMIKHIGYGKIVTELGGHSLEKRDGYELIEFPLPKEKEPSNPYIRGNDTVLKVLKMLCPSTKVYYTLRVPPQCKNIAEALNWTYGVEMWNMQNGKNESIKIISET